MFVRERGGGPKEGRTVAIPMRERVEGWVNDFDFVAEEVELDEDSPYEWCLRVQPPSEPPLELFVAHKQAPFVQMILQSTISVSEIHLEALHHLGARAVSTFITDLQLQICMPSIELAFDIDAPDPENMRVIAPPKSFAVTLSSRLIEEDVTRAKFYDRYITMQVAFTRMTLMFHRMVFRGDWP